VLRLTGSCSPRPAVRFRPRIAGLGGSCAFAIGAGHVDHQLLVGEALGRDVADVECAMAGGTEFPREALARALERHHVAAVHVDGLASIDLDHTRALGGGDGLAVDRLAVEHAVVPSGSTCLGSAHGEHKAGDQGGGGNGAVHESSYFGGRVTRESHLRRSPWKEL